MSVDPQSALARLEAGEVREVEELEALLEPLTDLIFQRADKAAALAGKVVEIGSHLPLDSRSATVIVKALSVVASASRTIADLEQARLTLSLAMDLADRFGLQDLKADLAIHGTYILLHDGEPELALKAAELALMRFAALQDLAGVGKALVTRAAILSASGRYEESCDSYRASLELLPEELGRYRCAALHNLSYSHFMKEEWEIAERYAAEASRLVPAADSKGLALLAWMRAKIAVKKKQFQNADRFFEMTVKAFESIPDPLNVALATLDVIKAWMARGKPEEACKQARNMLALLTPLRRYKALSISISELTQAARMGTIQAAMLNRVAQEITKARSKA